MSLRTDVHPWMTLTGGVILSCVEKTESSEDMELTASECTVLTTR